jgi:hypothetical protein
MFEELATVIDRDEARARGLKWYFTGQPCRHGHTVDRLVSNNRCRACNNLENANYRAANRDRARATTRRWQRQNPAWVNANCMARKARKLQARLKGTEVELRMVYAEAQPGEHVDHIVPLIHPLVCGLHVPWNLQYLPGPANVSKKNSFDPSGPQGELGYV